MNDTLIFSAITGITPQFLFKNRNRRYILGIREEKKSGNFQRNPHSHWQS